LSIARQNRTTVDVSVYTVRHRGERVNLISGFLIRQVADKSGGPPADEIGDAMKKARDMNPPDPLAYIRTRFVKIGSSDVDFAIVNGNLIKGHDYPDGTIIDSYLVNGIAAFNQDETGIYFCMYKEYAYDTPVGLGHYWNVPFGGSLAVNYTSEIQHSQLWREIKEGMGNTIYKVPFTWNIPLFNTLDEANSFMGLAETYWESGSTSDFETMKQYMEQHMAEPD